MPDKETIERARRDKRAGKSAATQAGEFVRDEIHKIRRREHGARSTKQAIAIGLSEARRAGVALAPPKGKASTRRSAAYADAVGQHKRKVQRRPRVARAAQQVLRKEPRRSASRKALSRQARAAARRSASARSAAARTAARTKGAAQRSAAARKAAAQERVSGVETIDRPRRKCLAHSIAQGNAT
jgi:hypothetical protein